MPDFWDQFLKADQPLQLGTIGRGAPPQQPPAPPTNSMQSVLQDPYGAAGRGIASMAGSIAPLLNKATPYLKAAWSKIAPYAEQPENVQWPALMQALKDDPNIDPVSKVTGVEVLNQIASAGTPVGAVMGMVGLGPAKRAKKAADVFGEAASLGQTALRAGDTAAPAVAQTAESLPAALAKVARAPKVADDLPPLLLKNPRKLAETAAAETLANGGFTIHPRTLRGAPQGSAISGVFPNQSPRTMVIPEAEFGPKKVTEFLKKNAAVYDKDKKAHLGLWRGQLEDGSPDGFIYIDVSKPFSDVRAATKFAERQNPGAIAKTHTAGQKEAGIPRQWEPTGVERNPDGSWPRAQNAVYDTSTGESPQVGNFADFVNSQEFQDRLDEMMPIGRESMAGGNWWDITNGPLKRVYGDMIEKVAGMMAVTSPQNSPVTNMQGASELIRRLIKHEKMRQPEWRAPSTAMGPLDTGFSPKAGAEFGSPSSMPGAELVAQGRMSEIGQDKVNDMYHALLGKARAVIDRHYAKIAEAPERGIFTGPEANTVESSMSTGKIEAYPLIENAVRTAANRAGVPLQDYSAWVWEGIRKTIKDTGKLFGQEHRASAIPDTNTGFNEIFTDLVEKKAKHLGISIADLEERLRRGDAELLTAILSTATAAGAGSIVNSALSGQPPSPQSGRPTPFGGGRQ